MYKTLQRSLLILFALLQCMSPLAHAHVNGIDAGHLVYSHELDTDTAADTYAESEQGAVIALSPAYPASDGPVVNDVQPVLLAADVVAGLCILRQPATAEHVVLSLPQTMHILPWSQAPPGRI